MGSSVFPDYGVSHIERYWSAQESTVRFNIQPATETSVFSHVQLTFKYETQTALFKDPVRTAQ